MAYSTSALGHIVAKRHLKCGFLGRIRLCLRLGHPIGIGHAVHNLARSVFADDDAPRRRRLIIPTVIDEKSSLKANDDLVLQRVTSDNIKQFIKIESVNFNNERDTEASDAGKRISEEKVSLIKNNNLLQPFINMCTIRVKALI